MRFDYLDKFTEQKKLKAKEHQELVRREQSALEVVQALKAKYERVLRESLQEKKDSTKELDQLSDNSDNIEQAQKIFDRRRMEREIYSTLSKDKEISSDDIVNAWNGEFIPAFNKEKRDPALDRLLKAKKELAEAMVHYRNVIKEFEEEKVAVRSELGDRYQYKLKGVDLQRRDETEKYFVTELDLINFNLGKIPSYLKGSDN